ncbi:PAS domain S-box protein [Methanofollis ethanolicus]|uniref:PAS domain S-box protein n=1 Tax=Methanofollis ethanolicus TaxID=488124 RepID=UPI000834E4FA|nr:PAS domain S-box protein [Methanofollis ethanolicus]
MIRILLVDDEPLLLNLACAFLEEEKDFTVTPVASAEEALGLLGVSPYDVVISDYQMPTMNGIELLRAVRAGHPDLPFILFTGRGRESVVIEALNCGADFYIQKGGAAVAQFTELVSKIRHAVGRRRAEVALRESDERFRSVVENASEGIMMTDDECHVVLWNKAAEEIFGYRPDEVLGRPFYHYLLPEKTRQHVHDSLGEFRMTGVIRRILSGRRFTGQVVKKGGEVFVAECTLSPVRYRGMWHSIAILRDVTGREEAVAALQESERQYRHLFEHSKDAIIVRTNEGVILKVNSATCELLGYPPDDLVGRIIGDFAVDTEKEKGREAMKAVVEKGDVTFRTQFVRSDGQVIDVEITSQSTCPERGIGQAIVRDISLSKQMAAALRRRDVILDAVVSAAVLLLRDRGAAGGIRAALAEIGMSAGAEGVYVLERQGGESDAWEVMHAWADNGFSLPCHPVIVPEGTDDGGVPRFRGSDGQRRSCILLPLQVGDGRSCSLGLEASFPEAEWSRYEREALEAAARVIGAALARETEPSPDA